MSTALADPHTTVDQLPLIPQPAREPVRFSLWGELTRQAEVRISTDGSAHLVVQVLQGKDALPFVAIRHAPAHSLGEIQQLADRMRPGVAIVVIGRGLQLTSIDGAHAVSPRICDAIHLANFCFVKGETE